MASTSSEAIIKSSTVYPDEASQSTRTIDLNEYAEKLRLHLEERRQTRNENNAAREQRPDESFFANKDSSMKKNSVFVKKLKTISESQRAMIMKDFDSLNLTKYITEVCQNIFEAKLKMQDVPLVVELCCKFHRLYAEFSTTLFDMMKKELPTKKEQQVKNMSKLRTDLRLFAELLALGVFEKKLALHILGIILMNLTTNDKEHHLNISAITAFCKYEGEDYMGLSGTYYLLKRAHDEGVNIPKSELFTLEQQSNVLKLMQDYYNSLKERISKLHNSLSRQEQKNMRTFESRGELHDEQKKSIDELRSTVNKLRLNAITLADFINLPPIELPEVHEIDEEERLANMLISIEGNTGRIQLTSGCWSSAYERDFYEKIPELRSILPKICFTESEKATIEIKNVDVTNVDVENIDESTADDEIAIESVDIDLNEENELEIEEEEDVRLLGIDEREPNYEMMTYTQRMDCFVKELPVKHSRQLVDQAAEEFAKYMNETRNRNRLVKTIIELDRKRVDLIPFYCRLVAVLQPLMPDVAAQVVNHFDEECHAQIKISTKAAANNVNLEYRVRTAKFIGELVKFKIFPKGNALRIVQKAICDLKGFNIDLVCTLLSTCGRFLFTTTETHQKTKVLLDIIARKRDAARKLAERHKHMLQTVAQNCQPYDELNKLPLVKRVHPPMMLRFINDLIFNCLNANTFDQCVRRLRKLDWADNVVRSYTTCCLSSPHRMKHDHVPALAAAVAHLGKYHEWIPLRVVDTLLENIRVGLELGVARPKHNQQRLADVRYLGELYNFKAINNELIFSTLYTLITFGTANLDQIESAPNIRHPFDPPTSMMRIRLVCQLLDTCGQYFNKGLAGQKLDSFLLYFARYYIAKREHPIYGVQTAESSNSHGHEALLQFPFETANLVNTTIKALRPKLHISHSFAAANQKIIELVEKHQKTFEENQQASANGVDITDFDEDENEPLTNDVSQILDDNFAESTGEGFDDYFDEFEDDYAHNEDPADLELRSALDRFMLEERNRGVGKTGRAIDLRIPDKAIRTVKEDMKRKLQEDSLSRSASRSTASPDFERRTTNFDSSSSDDGNTGSSSSEESSSNEFDLEDDDDNKTITSGDEEEEATARRSKKKVMQTSVILVTRGKNNKTVLKPMIIKEDESGMSGAYEGSRSYSESATTEQRALKEKTLQMATQQEFEEMTPVIQTEAIEQQSAQRQWHRGMNVYNGRRGAPIRERGRYRGHHQGAHYGKGRGG